MRVQVCLHGWLRPGAGKPESLVASRPEAAAGGKVEMELPEGSDIAGAIAVLQGAGALPDRRGYVVMVDGRRASSDRALHDGEEVHLYPMISGG
jgi:molybdopterin converting factor small subunit